MAARTRGGRFAVVLLGLCGGLLTAGNATAVAFRLPNQDPEAISRGNAFAATADDPAAIYYNPAGITQLEGENLSIGLYLISAGDQFESSTTGARASTQSELQPVPQMYFTDSPTNSPFSFGVGVYVPYGLSLDWGPTPPFRDVAIKGNLLYTTINPVAAWRINDQLSIGLGPTVNYSKVGFTQGIAAPPDTFRFSGDDADYSFTAGLLWKPFEMLALGVNYRYKTTMDYRGSSAATTSLPIAGSSGGSKASLRFPQNVVMGISFRPTTNWNVEVDADWTDWDDVTQINFQNTALGNIIFPLNYESGFMYEFGVSRRLGERYLASIGYIYSQNSSPNQYFNPIIPDSNLQLGNIGLVRKGKHWDLAVSYTLAINPGREVSGSAFGPTVSGDYHTANNAINFSANYKW